MTQTLSKLSQLTAWLKMAPFCSSLTTALISSGVASGFTKKTLLTYWTYAKHELKAQTNLELSFHALLILCTELLLHTLIILDGLYELALDKRSLGTNAIAW